MVAIAREVAPGRWRASAGRYFEDFTIGEADNTWFTLLTMNQHPLHFDAAYAAKSEFGRPVVNSCLTLSIVTPARGVRGKRHVGRPGFPLSRE